MNGGERREEKKKGKYKIINKMEMLGMTFMPENIIGLCLSVRGVNISDRLKPRDFHFPRNPFEKVKFLVFYFGKLLKPTQKKKKKN